MTILHPPEDLVARFQRDMAALAPVPDRFGLAVSGGPDSVALLLLAAAAFPGSIAVATIDHGLRPESRDEAVGVATLCAALNVPCSILPVRVDTAVSSLQQAARRARYGAIARWLEEEGMNCVATGHHLDDQAETLLMRLMRGAGIAGLAGVRPRATLLGNERLWLVRPLLRWRKAELLALVNAAGVKIVDDPSNRNARFDRTIVRMRLAAESWLNPAALARSAGAAADAEEALDWAARDLQQERVWHEGEWLLLDPSGLPREFKRRLLLAVLREIDPDAAPRGAELDRLLARLDDGKTATLSGVRCSGGPEWRFQSTPPRRRSK